MPFFTSKKLSLGLAATVLLNTVGLSVANLTSNVNFYLSGYACPVKPATGTLTYESNLPSRYGTYGTLDGETVYKYATLDANKTLDGGFLYHEGGKVFAFIREDTSDASSVFWSDQMEQDFLSGESSLQPPSQITYTFIPYEGTNLSPPSSSEYLTVEACDGHDDPDYHQSYLPYFINVP